MVDVAVNTPWGGNSSPILVDTHGTCRYYPSLFHTRQLQAWRTGFGLVDQVIPLQPGNWLVPAQSTTGLYRVERFRLNPDGYLYWCECPANRQGGWVCKHAFACYLWRLEQMGWHLKPPL